jgi:hypothetical protein
MIELFPAYCCYSYLLSEMPHPQGYTPVLRIFLREIQGVTLLLLRNHSKMAFTYVPKQDLAKLHAALEKSLN